MKLLKKGNTPLINIQLLKWGREFGIDIYWNFLVCIPGESAAWYTEVLEWLPWIVHLQPPGVSPIRFDRFSLYHERPTDYGLKLLPNRAYSYIYPLSIQELDDLAYYFEDESDLMSASYSDENGKKLFGKNSRASWEHAALKAFVDQWIELFKSGTPPILQIIDDDGQHLRIVDTRPCATGGEIDLEGLAYQIYKTCDRALTQSELIRNLHRDHNIDLTWNQIQPVVDELQSRKIFLELDNRVMSLAVSGLIRSLPDRRDLPGGYVDIAGFMHDTRQQLQSQRPAWTTFTWETKTISSKIEAMI